MLVFVKNNHSVKCLQMLKMSLLYSGHIMLYYVFTNMAGAQVILMINQLSEDRSAD